MAARKLGRAQKRFHFCSRPNFTRPKTEKCLQRAEKPTERLTKTVLRKSLLRRLTNGVRGRFLSTHAILQGFFSKYSGFPTCSKSITISSKGKVLFDKRKLSKWTECVSVYCLGKSAEESPVKAYTCALAHKQALCFLTTKQQEQKLRQSTENSAGPMLNKEIKKRKKTYPPDFLTHEIHHPLQRYTRAKKLRSNCKIFSKEIVAIHYLK